MWREILRWSSEIWIASRAADRIGAEKHITCDRATKDGWTEYDRFDSSEREVSSRDADMRIILPVIGDDISIYVSF
jgi:hypothetical protein